VTTSRRILIARLLCTSYSASIGVRDEDAAFLDMFLVVLSNLRGLKLRSGVIFCAWLLAFPDLCLFLISGLAFDIRNGGSVGPVSIEGCTDTPGFVLLATLLGVITCLLPFFTGVETCFAARFVPLFDATTSNFVILTRCKTFLSIPFSLFWLVFKPERSSGSPASSSDSTSSTESAPSLNSASSSRPRFLR